MSRIPLIYSSREVLGDELFNQLLHACGVNLGETEPPTALGRICGGIPACGDIDARPCQSPPGEDELDSRFNASGELVPEDHPYNGCFVCRQCYQD